jgi:hypothetical protein
MSSPLIVLYLVFAATLMRALLLSVDVLPTMCARCGLPFERRQLGDPVCRCARHD